ncbi:MAG: aspartate--tRNA ligase, partial [Peptostreptococcaceae bacterium]
AERSSKNPNLPTGDIEIFATELKLLNKSETPPIYIKDDDNVSEELRLKYRYLDLRKSSMQKNLILRSKVASIVRNYLTENNFFEIETPFLIKPTPEGARDYLVPSRVNEGKFYALPQSPQLFKQLLMVSGMDRYFQIVKCFRDEDLRADRQPEFTQIDCEMSFVEQEDVMDIMEKMVQRIFKEVLNIDVKLPLQTMTYAEAMEKYGSDKPDTRFGYELTNISDVVADCGFGVFANASKDGMSVRGINVKGQAETFSKKQIGKLEDHAKTYKAKGLAWIKVGEDREVNSPIAKFFTQEEMTAILDKMNAEVGDLLLFVADKNSVVLDALGQVRLEVARRLDLLDNNVYNMLWVTEFPVFEEDEENGRMVAKHHPFTSPLDEDLEKLEGDDKASLRAKAYDMVINGYEVGGGSVRIFNSDVQQKMFKALGFTEEEANEKFGFLLDAFKYGTPPHAGMAFGLDRLIMILAGTNNIKDVIAFPKNQSAVCPMTNAPAVAEEQQLNELNIKVDIQEKE